MTALWRVLGVMRGRRGWLLLGAAVAVLGTGFAVALMGLAGAVAIGGGSVGALAALRGIGPGRVVLRWAERMLTHDAMFRALTDVRVWFFRGLAARAAGGLGFRRAGDALARLAGDVETLDGVYLRLLVPLAGAIVLLLALPWIIGRVDAGVALVVTALFAVAALAAPYVAARGTEAAGTRLAEAAAALRVAALDTLTGLREVRAFGAEGRMLSNLQSREAALLAAQHTAMTRAAWAGAGAMLCGQLAIVMVLLVAGAHPVAAVLFLFVVVAAFEAVSMLPRAGAFAGHAAAAAARVLEAADGAVAVPDPVRPAPVPDGTSLRFEGVSFRWRADRPPVFDGLSLEIAPGSRVALIGPSGVGKSTLAALALKVVAPQQGRVLLGGADLADLAAADVRRRIGWLSQATHLFDDTIRANLLLAQPEANDAMLWQVLDAARIGDDVRALPDGLDAWVGEGGARFSGGQARRLALARALLSPAPVLILDEPCAGLDADTERAFFQALNAAGEGRTVVLIVHRLTGAERVDRIWRLSAGRAVAAAG